MWVSVDTLEQATVFCFMFHEEYLYWENPSDDYPQISDTRIHGVCDEHGNTLEIPRRHDNMSPEDLEDYWDSPMVEDMLSSIKHEEYWWDESPWGDAPTTHSVWSEPVYFHQFSKTMTNEERWLWELV